MQDDEELAEFLASRGGKVNNKIFIELADNKPPKTKKPRESKAKPAEKENVYTSFSCFYFTKLKPRFVSCDPCTNFQLQVPR
jgi:hypothetical protein